ncbi:hypothetical protein [Thiocystis violascens]|uniref:Uncharacterized protein n=1 Tax=Thiocystis violascens (strain ATCC 17096 / DSM 198 / 6111) TaxID=765911 RepID=I3YHC9_THIV6|nr:hypothetical protein [Thiocystis violascens]AFL76397.1 hypothetical protein Thivi_4606 [Thiocystis violascens DSM 198]
MNAETLKTAAAAHDELNDPRAKQIARAIRRLDDIGAKLARAPMTARVSMAIRSHGLDAALASVTDRASAAETEITDIGAELERFAVAENALRAALAEPRMTLERERNGLDFERDRLGRELTAARDQHDRAVLTLTNAGMDFNAATNAATPSLDELAALSDQLETLALRIEEVETALSSASGIVARMRFEPEPESEPEALAA